MSGPPLRRPPSGGSANARRQLLAAQGAKNKTPARTPVQSGPSNSKLLAPVSTTQYPNQRKRPRELEPDDIFASPPPAQRARVVATPHSIPTAARDAAAARTAVARATAAATPPHPPPPHKQKLPTFPPIFSSHRGGNASISFRRYPSSTSSNYYASKYGQHSQRQQSAVSAPSGLMNLGNTCYLNAVLQSLISLPHFSVAIRSAAAACGKSLPADGVLRAIAHCLAERDASIAAGRSAFSPEQIKLAVGRRRGAFRGSFQQDAHEFFCGLMEATQDEVLAIEAARCGRRQLRATETCDPVTRVFGFAVEHEMTCSACGKVSCVTEQCTHLSLDLLKGGRTATVPPGVDAMLSTYFKEESIEKGCEGCGAECVEHNVCHTIKRLPQILALHVKRFQVAIRSGGTVVTCSKVRDPITIPTALRLRRFCMDAAHPPLPPFHLASPGHEQSGSGNNKENLEVNASPPSPSPSLPLSLSLLPEMGTLPPPPPPPSINTTSNFYENSYPDFGSSPPQQKIKTFSRKDKKRNGIFPPSSRGAAAPSYWDAPAPPKAQSLWTHTLGGIITNATNKGVRVEEEEEESLDMDLAAALEASRKEAELRNGGVEGGEGVDAEMETVMKRSLEEFEAAQKRYQEEDGTTTTTFEKRSRAVELADAETPPPASPSSFRRHDNEDTDLAAQAKTGAPPPPPPPPEIIEADSNDTTECSQELWPGQNSFGGAARGGISNTSRTTTVPLAPYHLSAVISHHGSSAESGHFTADTFNATNGVWHRFNDAQVHRINGSDAAANEMREQDCYMLFYAVSQLSTSS